MTWIIFTISLVRSVIESFFFLPFLPCNISDMIWCQFLSLVWIFPFPRLSMCLSCIIFLMLQVVWNRFGYWFTIKMFPSFLFNLYVWMCDARWCSYFFSSAVLRVRYNRSIEYLSNIFFPFFFIFLFRHRRRRHRCPLCHLIISSKNGNATSLRYHRT